MNGSGHPTVPLPSDLTTLDAWIAARENDVANEGLKPDNAARVVWTTPTKPARTQYSFVYLHGFSASQGEASPLHRQLAAAFDANLFLARLPGHGLSGDKALAGITMETIIAASVEALAIGQRLGERVILVGTSLGASLALNLAAEFPAAVAALVLWSPGIRPFDPQALEAAARSETVVKRDQVDGDGFRRQYWSEAVHADGYRAMARFFSERMCDTIFERVTCPCFLGCYYRDDANQDTTAAVSSMLEMMQTISTPEKFRRTVLFAEGAHALAAPSRSPAAASVLQASVTFLREVLTSES